MVDRRAGTLLICGAALLAVGLLAILLDPRAALAGWLAGAVAFAAVPMGALLLLMMMQLIPGAWGDELKLSCEAGAMLSPLGLIAFLPVLLGMDALYSWTQHPPEPAFAVAWLHPAGFGLRTVAWFALLTGLTWAMLGRRAPTPVACAGLILFILGATLVNVDWLMSLDPKFASSGFGLQVLALQVTTAFCALLLFRMGLGPINGELQVPAGLLLTLLLLVFYLSFTPFVVLWSGNLPPGVAWYRLRQQGLWPAASWASAVLAGVPLILLFFPRPRADRRWLAGCAASALIAMLIQFAWYAVPPHGALGAALAVLAECGMLLVAAGALSVAFRLRLGVRSPVAT